MTEAEGNRLISMARFSQLTKYHTRSLLRFIEDGRMEAVRMGSRNQIFIKAKFLEPIRALRETSKERTGNHNISSHKGARLK